MSLTFEPERHIYKWDNVIVPNVTRILEEMGCYRGTEYFEEKHRILGHYIHEACDLDDKGLLNFETLDPALAGYVESWRKVKEFLEVDQILLSEQSFYSAIHGYAGTIDKLVKCRLGILAPDLKHGSHQAAYDLQLGAYFWLLRENGRGVDRSASVYLREDGKLPKWEPANDRNNMRDFFNILGGWKWKKEHNLI